MKKFLVVGLTVLTMACLTACGEDVEEDVSTEAAVEAEADVDVEEADVDVEEVEADVDVEEDGFSLLDVTADLVDSCIYAVDENNAEWVITLFRDNDENHYVTLMVVQDGAGDFYCGPWDDSNAGTLDDDNGITWSAITTNDVYTGDEFTVVFVDADDGSVAITNADFSFILEGTYLSNQEAIAYMASAISLMDGN